MLIWQPPTNSSGDVHNQMIVRRSLALNTLLGSFPLLPENQKTQLLLAPFTGCTRFGGGGRISEGEKVNLEQAKSFTAFSHPAAPSTSYASQPYVGRGWGYRKGSSSHWAGNIINPAPSANATKPSNDSQGLTVMVPHDSTKRQLNKLADSQNQKCLCKGKGACLLCP